MASGFLQPARFDGGDAAGVGASGIADLGGNDPLGAALSEPGAGEDAEAEVAGAGVGEALLCRVVLHAGEGERAGD